MRAIWGVICGVLGLLIVLGLVGVLAKKQLAATGQSVPVLAVPAPGGESPTSQPVAKVQAQTQSQSQQIQQQYKQALDGAMQQARPEPEEKQ